MRDKSPKSCLKEKPSLDVGDIVTVHPKQEPPFHCSMSRKRIGAAALLCRECPYTSFVWVRFFMHAEDPVYRLHEFGPYHKSEVKAASATIKRLFAPLISKITPPSFERLVQQ